MTNTITPHRVSLAENMKVSPTKPTALLGVRHVQALLISFGFFCCYATRVTMSVTVVAMTSEANQNFKSLGWTESQKSLVLSSFFWGYVLTQVPGGMLAHRWGAHRIFVMAVGLCGLGTLTVPMAAWYGSWKLVCVARVFCGFCQGVVPPVMHTLLAKWVPTTERGSLTTFVYSGGWIGNVVSLQSSGLLCSSRLGWPGCFYFWGLVCLIWSLLWKTFGKESPADHPSISEQEKNFIESSLGVVEVIENGVMSSLPYLSAWLMSFPVSQASDWAIRRRVVSVKMSRMLCNTMGMVLPGLALMVLGFISKDQRALAVVVMIFAITANISIYCGHHANHMDLSPNFSGPLMGFTNCVANMSSIVAPLVAGLIITQADDVVKWRVMFLMTSVIWISGAVIFLLFGSVKIQPWNDAPVRIAKKQSSIFAIHEVPTIPQSLKDLRHIEKIER